MAIKQVYPVYECTEPRKEFVIDTDADVANLPTCGTGSTALSVASGDVFVLNASGQWKKLGGGE